MNDERELDLMDGLRRAIAIARWMSGSKDFAPEGQAHLGWIKARTELNDIEKLLEAPSCPTP